jgi:hypothetical protein
MTTVVDSSNQKEANSMVTTMLKETRADTKTLTSKMDNTTGRKLISSQ